MQSVTFLITLGAGWVMVMVITYAVQAVITKGAKTMEEDKAVEDRTDISGVKKVMKILRFAITVVALVIAVAIGMFLHNFYARPHIPTVRDAVVDDSYVAPTKEEVAKTNEEIVNKPHIEKEEAAEKDNNKAMQEANELFK
ncbi:MAG: hypothetical protein PVG39_02530 [Desulfobacteraceae bacterium]|jgi:hypothetical protein